MAHPHVARLVPLTETLDRTDSGRAVDLTEGANQLGRDVVSVPDKRLSRKHLTLTVSSVDGTASLFVEGSNPVVVNSGKGRMKIRSGERAEINDGDILELIPGHHFFKYQAMSDNKDTDKNVITLASGVPNADEVQCYNGKRSRNHSEDHVPDKQGRNGDNDCKLIRRFNVSKQLLPMTFRLLRVQGLPPWANTSSVSIDDMIQGDIRVAILSNYMVDIDWLITACPALASIPHVLVIHGEGDGTLDHMKQKKPPNWVLHKPSLPIAYGTHHSKAMLLVYPKGVRIIVHTANLIFVDWNNKSQGLWMQDFPWKDQSSPSKSSEFEADLVDYLSALKWPEFNVNLPARGTIPLNPSFFKKFNYQDAMVRLIASIPGYHSGNNLKKWGHMKLRSILQQCTFGKEFMKSPLVYQFSSLGSLDEKWMAELATSMSSGFAEDMLPLGLGDPMIIWPSVEDVRCSLEGYAAGNAIPSPLKNVEKEFLKKYWSKWKAGHTGRCRAMPHIKTFTRYNGQNLAWLLLTSANLSKAAWGALQKNSSQLMIRSYELGVLFLPSVVKLNGKMFSCTDDLPESGRVSREKSEVLRTRLVTLAWQGNEEAEPSTEYIPLPVPYELPPKPYSSEDNGNHFSLEVGPFDTVQEIKQKIEGNRGIPACNQTLIFNGQILQNDYAINNYEIVTGSHFKLVLGVPPERIGLHVRTPRDREGYPVEVSANDTVKHLKEVVASIESVDPNRLALLLSGSDVELQDHCSIRECRLELQPNVDVLVKPMLRVSPRPPPPLPSSHISSSSRNITVKVLPWEGRQKFNLLVDPSEKVASLRNKLEDMQPDLANGLPPEGYFFIHNQSFMEEDQSFLWHGVSHGDNIEVFKGRITTNDSARLGRNTVP